MTSLSRRQPRVWVRRVGYLGVELGLDSLGSDVLPAHLGFVLMID